MKLLEDFKKRVDGAFTKKLSFRITTENGRDLTSDFESGNNKTEFKKGDGSISLSLSGREKIKTLVLREDITQSQRVEKFEVFFKTSFGFKKAFSGTTIGSKKIIRFAFENATDEVRICFTQSRSNPVIRSVELYG